MSTFQNWRSFFISHIRWHCSNWGIFGHNHKFGMYAKSFFIVPKYFIARLKRLYVFANFDNFSGKFVSKYLVFGTEQPAKKPGDKILGTPETTIGAVYCGGMHFYQHFIGFWTWFQYFSKLQHFRRTVLGMNDCFHSVLFRFNRPIPHFCRNSNTCLAQRSVKSFPYSNNLLAANNLGPSSF